MRLSMAGAALVGASAMVGCVGDDTVQSGPGAPSFPSDAAAYVDATVAQGDAGDDAGQDGSVATGDAGDSSSANACTVDGGAHGTRCSGVCVDTTSGPRNCGTCASACEAGAVCSASKCDDVAGSLEGLEWYVPCTSAGTACTATDPPVVSATLSGTSGATYDVTLHFRGVVEEKTYTPNPVDAGADAGDAGVSGPVATGTNASFFVTNATPASDTYNVYSLSITPPGGSTPTLVAYLNRGTSSITQCWLVDYTVTLPMQGGASIQLTAATIDGQEISNLDANGNPVVVPGLSFDGGTFNGQFIQMDVVSVTRAP